MRLVELETVEGKSIYINPAFVAATWCERGSRDSIPGRWHTAIKLHGLDGLLHINQCPKEVYKALNQSNQARKTK